MVRLFGRTFTRRQIAERCGSLSQFAGVRLMTLGDGVERGVRMLEFRTGRGLRFTVLVERAMDIAECEYKGQAIGWHSPAGFRHPGPSRIRRRRRPGLGAIVLRLPGDLRARPHSVAVRGTGGQLQLPRQEARAPFASRPRQHDTGTLDWVRRDLGRRPLRALGGGRRSAVGRVWRRLASASGELRPMSGRMRSTSPIAS